MGRAKSTPAKGDLVIRYVDPASLKAYAQNARTHSPEQIAAVAASIKEFGFTTPVLVDDAGIIAGHGRVMAALSLKLKRIPTVSMAGFTLEQRRAYIIADNALALRAGWDMDLLRSELLDLKGAGFDLGLVGFQPFELADIFATKRGAVDPDEAPPLEKVPVSRIGDVWCLGAHRLACGDSTDQATVAALIGDAKPGLMVTDPPYGVEYDPTWRTKATGQKVRNSGKVKNDDRVDWSAAWALFPGDVAYVWHADRFASLVQTSLESQGFEMRSQIIWVKDRFALSRGHYHWRHEPCQPGGTMVQRVAKAGRWKKDAVIESVPIETLRAGDSVVSFGNAKVYRNGREVERVGSRSYVGNMHSVSVGPKTTRATPEHQFTARFDPSKPKAALLYLMRRGDRWRVGVCGMFNSRGFGPAVRLRQEQGDALWVLSAHEDLQAARVVEQVTSCIYGIPTTHWETERGLRGPSRSKEQIEQIYQQIGTDRVVDGALRLLHQRALRLEYPMVVSGEVGAFSRKASRIVRACNLIPGVMQLPVPTTGEKFNWETISAASFAHYAGMVYSMDVAIDHHYVADGIVTHNCWYAVRKGYSANWQGNRKLDTVWRIEGLDDATAKVVGRTIAEVGLEQTVWEIPMSVDDGATGHGTQKPVECMRRPIEHNSRAGDVVYEPFSGSGTTLIAGEMTGRVVLACELDPLYVDVAVRRWQNFTGKEAVLLGTSSSFSAIATERGVAKAA